MPTTGGMMPHEPNSRTAKLRRQLQHASVGDRVELDFGGEYEGPFLLDRPIHLVGHGPSTQLYGRGCPALVVRSPGVRIERLGLADSYSIGDGICLLAEVEAQPELVDVELAGRMAVMNPGQLVDLGHVLPSQKAFTLLEIEVEEPAILECAESSAKWLWAGVGDSFEQTFKNPGKYLLRLACDGGALRAGTLILGELKIVSQAKTLSLWVTACVLAAPPPRLATGEVALRLSGGPRLRFGDGFLIGRDRFLGSPVAEGLAERQALLLRDAEAHGWAVYQPWRTSNPTLVNGEPLAQGARKLLLVGDILEAGKMRLEVEPSPASSPLVLPAGWIHFGTAAALNGGYPLPVSYLGAQEARIGTRSVVPWLAVEPAEFTVGNGSVPDVRLKAVSTAVPLAPGVYRDRSSLVLISPQELYYLDVSFDAPEVPALPTPIDLPAAPASRDPASPKETGEPSDSTWDVESFIALGSVHQDEWDRGLAHATAIEVRNSSAKPLHIRVSVLGDMGALDLPDRLIVPAHSKGKLPVGLRPGFGARLPLGALEARVVLRANAQERSVQLALLVLASRLRLPGGIFGKAPVRGSAPGMDVVVEPNHLDFGRVEIGQSPSPLVITVRNRGEAPATLSIDGRAPYIQVHPSERIECPAAGSRTLEVRLRLGLFQRQGVIDEPRGLVLAAGGHRYPVSIRVEVTPRRAQGES